MASRTTTFPLLLTSNNHPRSDVSSDSLSHLIGRINADRGHLRNVTEDGLEEEIQKLQSQTQDAADSSQDAGPQEADLETRHKQLYDARMSMLQDISDAHNQALLLLDSVSFLLKDRIPRAADTMSPALKGMFQQGGGLSYSMLPLPKPSTADAEQDNLITMGITLNSLNKNADSLLDAASKLQGEVKKETQYWDDVLSIRDSGWSICRVKGQRNNTLGVRYGFPEASHVFAFQSTAIMRPNEAGHIVLDSGVTQDPKTVRVRIFEGQTLLADCRHSAEMPNSEDISTRLLRARDSLFEEELFHELEQEARTLLNYGVRIDNHELHLPLSLESSHTSESGSAPRRLVLSLESLQTDAITTSSDSDVAKHARAFAISMRLLLTNVYRKRFQERSKPPAPLSLQKKPPQNADILRFLMTFIQHQSASSQIAKIIENTCNLLRLAKLEASSAHEDDDAYLAAATTTPMEHLIDTLAGPWKTTHSLKLLEDVEIAIVVTTALQAPSYGSRYQIKTSSPTSQSREVTYSLGRHTILHVNRDIRTALTDHIRNVSKDWALSREVSSDRSELQRSGASGKTKTLHLGLNLSGDGLLMAIGALGSDKSPHQRVWRLAVASTISFDEAVKSADTD